MATATSLPRASVRPKQRYALVYLFTLWTLFLCLTTTSLRASAVPWRLATGLAPGCMQGRMQQLGAVVWRRSAGGLNTFQDAVRYIFCAWDYLIWAIVELITWTFQTTRTAVELRVVNVEKKGWRYFWTPMEYPPVAKFPGVTWTAPEPATASGSVLSTSLPGAGLRNGQAG